jgi:hypothetical protein
MHSVRVEISRAVNDVLRLAARVVPAPPPGLLALSARALPPPMITQLNELWRRLPPERLEALARLPLMRRALMEAIFWQMPLYLDARRPTATPIAIRWQLAGREDGGFDLYDIVISDGTVRTIRGGSETPPALTITADPLELVRIASGSSDPLSAYLTGRLSARGDLLVAARMASLFRLPSARRGGRVPAR